MTISIKFETLCGYSVTVTKMEGGIKRSGGQEQDGDGVIAPGKKIKTEILDEVVDENKTGKNRMEVIESHEEGCQLSMEIERTNESRESTGGTDEGSFIVSETVADNTFDTLAKGERNLLRENIQFWLHKYPKLDRENVLFALEELAAFRNQDDKACETWHSEVLYLREMQKVITWASENMKHDNEQNQNHIVTLLIQILHPHDKVQAKYLHQTNRNELQ